MGKKRLIRMKIHFVISRFSAILVILFSVFILPLRGEQANEPTWKELAQKEKLSQSDVEKLAENGIVITDTEYKQIFTPYIEGSGFRDGGVSLFITTDSLINAYHVLYEESILRLEKANANKLGEILKFVLANLPKVNNNVTGNPELMKAALERAMIVVGTAMKLLDENYKIEDNNIEKIAGEEVEKIKQATAQETPSWLGGATFDLMEIDYSRYKPRSFYTSSEHLSKYFRAVSWLQSIPFRLDKDDEFLSILILGNCLAPSQFAGDVKKQQEYKDFFSTFKMLIGPGDDWDVISAENEIEENTGLNLDENDLEKIRLKMARDLGKRGALINDQVRFPPLDPNSVAEPQFRFISAYRTPDAVLFQKTTDTREFKRDFPNGLEVCTVLGSDFARSKLDYSDKAKLLKTIDDTKRSFSGDSLYLDYMQCLACLLDEPPAKSPDFMKKSTWQAKSCNTALAGWSQLRHTWSLQAKEAVSVGGGFRIPAGFVEPEPEFYEHMALLAQKTREILEKAGAFEADYSEISSFIMDYDKLCEKNESKYVYSFMINRSDEEMQNADFCQMLMSEMGIKGTYLPGAVEYSDEDLSKMKKIAQDLLEAKLPEEKRLKERILYQYYDLKSLWENLDSLSLTMKNISQKELEGQDIKEFNIFIAGYGASIANIMLYKSNSYLIPKDDSMRIVDVYFRKVPDGYLQAGIARPRAIYVLYPWQGSLVLCRGAVMPYYEFISQNRLTDAEWKNLLDSSRRPDVPGWIKPVFSENNLSKPVFERR